MKGITRLGLLFFVSICIFFGVGMANTGSMTLSPAVGDLGMHCIYPVNFFVNVDNSSVKALDMRVIYSGDVMQFTGVGIGTLVTPGEYIVTGGLTSIVTDLGWSTYPIGSTYRLFNRSSFTGILSGNSDNLYYTRYFQTITNDLTGYIDFYFSGGRNGDDSNIQSGVTNNFIDILGSLNSGYYNFVARPCILDTDPALFTGYLSGSTVSYMDGIGFTIYDFTGEHDFSAAGYDVLDGLMSDVYTLTGIYRYNNTVHYRWNGAMTNPANYVPANLTSTGIDNQYGVNSGTIQVSLSGVSFGACAFTGEDGGIYSGGTLVNTSFVLNTWNNADLFLCIPISTSLDMGYALTWNRNNRGYTCLLSSTGLVGASGVQLDSCQTLIVTVTGMDFPNYNGTSNTGILTFPITITGIDNTPPYIVTSVYNWTGAYHTGDLNTTGAGPVFSAEQISGRDLWTKLPIEINLTGNKIIIMTNVVGFSGTDLNIYVSGGNGISGINQSLIVTGNMSGFVTFKDINTTGMNPNYGQTYETGGTKYTYDFNVDVFWIDTITTEITGSLAYTGENGQRHHATLTLTGFATGNTSSIKDDEFYVYVYSGVDGASNSPDVTYVTGYSNTGYSLYHSGIVFNNNRTGYIYYTDRAGNTGEMYVNVTGINKSFEYAIIAIPGNRDYSQGAQSGIIARFTFVSGYESSSFNTWTGDIVFSGLIKTDGISGADEFTFGFPGTLYTLILEGQSDLSTIMAVEITGSRVFNFTNTDNISGSIGDLRLIAGDLITFQNGGLDIASEKDGQINGSDIGSMLAWFQVDYRIYSGGFQVWTGGVGKTEVLGGGSAWTPFAQYHPADLNGNGQIAVDDMQIQVANFALNAVRTRSTPWANLTFFDDFN